MNVLARVIQRAWEEANKPESYVRGDEFERFVRERLFTRDSYDLLHRTHSYTDNKNDYIASSLEPDFRFRSIENNFQFYVEAKFRANYHNGGLEWCTSHQLKRYQAIDNRVPVLIAIGLGGQPKTPERVFLIPVSHIKFVKLYPSFLNRYEIQPKHSVSLHHLKNIL
jgi:hypothetical protein